VTALRWLPAADGECRSECGRAVISRHRYARGSGRYFRLRLDGRETDWTLDSWAEAKRVAERVVK